MTSASSSPEAILYAAPISLYSGKARCYLRYKHYAFKEVLPSAHIIRTIIKPRTGVGMVPVLITPEDEAVQDTSVIIDHVEEELPDVRPVIPTTPLQRFVAQLIELYADEWLLMPAMHYRWAYLGEHLGMIMREFGALFKPDWPELLHPVAGLPLTIYFGLGHGKVLGINRHTRPEIERTYQNFLEHFDRHLAEHDFVLGGAPSLADFGLMAPLYAHLYRDPYPGRMMQRMAPRVHDWVERMNDPEHATHEGAWLGDDQIPETLAPILQHALEEHLPIIIDSWRRLKQWSTQHPDASCFPRFIGDHTFTLGRASSTRAVQSYTAWFSQRTFDAFKALSEEEKAHLEALVGARAIKNLSFEPPFTLQRIKGRVSVM